VIAQPAFSVEPWALRETAWDPTLVAHAESLFALSNGLIGMRGALEEGAPAGERATFVNGVFELRTVHGERGVGDPDVIETIVGVPDGTRLRLLVDDEALDLRDGTIEAHERTLDLRAGTLTRALRWCSGSGRRLALRSRRLVSLAEPHLAALVYEVEPLDGRAHLQVESQLSIDDADQDVPGGDPRAGATLPGGTLVPLIARGSATRVVLAHRVRRSGICIASGMDHRVHGGAATHVAATGRRGCVIVEADTQPGAPLVIEKLLAYHAGIEQQPDVLAQRVAASLDRACAAGFAALVTDQRLCLDAWWASADVELDGDAHVQQALRFGLFHLFQAAACAEDRPIPAKGLTGRGYDGHAFWDTETFVLPALTYTAPSLARNALRWRAATLDAARAKARGLGLRGAAFAWRTISGRECSTYLPAGTAAFHVNADIADAAVRYEHASGDAAFAREAGAPLLVETARLWHSLGYHDEDGAFHIDGVTGPDEYSVLVDDNLYTNVMAQANLRAAADAVERHGPVADASSVEVADWRRAADAMAIPYDPALGVHAQDADFTRHERFPFERIGVDDYPLLLHVPYVQLYRSQVIKQPDLVLALHLRGEAFTREQKRRAFAYYEPLTVRDSSLAAATNAVIAAELGYTELAYDYLAEATLLDLHDVTNNTRDGLHLAALAGGWIAAVAGLGGMRNRRGQLRLAPRLHPPLKRLAFALAFRGRRLRIAATPDEVTYTLQSGEPLEFTHFDQAVIVALGAPVRARVPPSDASEPPSQPPGRRPHGHSPDHHDIHPGRRSSTRRRPDDDA